jgi:hypothetical protein
MTVFMPNPFQTREPFIDGNPLIRTPQQEAYSALREYAAESADDEREVGVVLPVGCGKAGCITLAPFAFRANRALVIAPGTSIARQLVADFDPANAGMFYQKCHVLTGGPYPEPVEIRGTTTNRADSMKRTSSSRTSASYKAGMKTAGCELYPLISST